MMNLIRKSLDVLTKKTKRLLLLAVFPLAVLNAVLTILSIGILMPFMALVVNPDIANTNAKIHWLYQLFNFSSVDKFVIMIGVVVLIVLISANLIAILSKYVYKNFIFQLYVELAQNLFDGYLKKSYQFFLNKNSSTLSKNVLNEVNTLIYHHYAPLIGIFTQVILIFFIIFLLLIVSIKVTFMILAILGSLFCMIHFFEKSKLKQYSDMRVISNEFRFKEAAEAFGGIKLIKLSGKESQFSNRFNKYNSQFINIDTMLIFISDCPKYFLEMIAFGGAIVIILILFSTSKSDTGEIIGILSLYVFSGYKIMPAIQSIINGLTMVRGHEGVIQGLYPELMANAKKNDTEIKSSPIEFSKEIKLEDLKFTYPNTTIPFPNNINLTIKANTSIGLVGTTGAGKSTLVDIILGLLEPQHGNIIVDGKPITEENLRGWQDLFGYVPQQIFLTDDTIENNIAFGLSEDQIDKEKLENAARMANLEEFVIELPLKYKTVIGERGIRLSGGQIQRIGIARALYNNPKILIFDEATSSLDGITEEIIIESIKRLSSQKTMIIIAHRLTTVSDCNTIYLLEKGEIVASGDYNQLINDNDQFIRMSKSHK